MTSGRPSIPPPRPRRRRRNRQLPVILFAAVLLVAGLAIVLARSSDEPEPSEALDPFLTEWSQGRDRAAARHTDAPRIAGAALVANRAGLDGARLAAETLELSENGDRATARVRMRWNVPGIGPWGYDTRVPLRKVDGEWKVRWRVTVVHPKLRDTERLGTTRELPRRAPIRDRSGQAIVQMRPVKRVGAVVGEVGDPRATATGLARVLGVDAGPILSQLRGGGPQQFVEAIMLREQDYAALQAELSTVPDVTTLDGTAPLAPTREFARALLGTVAPATAEQLEQLGTFYAPGDQVGQWGLQARFERRLAGTPDRRIVMRNAEGVAFETLFERDGRVGRAVRTTLDRRVQLAAERALAGRADEAALVAVDVELRQPACRREPAHGVELQPRHRGPLPARLHVQGGEHRGAAAQWAAHQPDRALSRHRHRAGQELPELRGERRRPGAVQPGLRPVLQHRVHQPGRPPLADRPDQDGPRLRAGPEPERACRCPPRRPRCPPARARSNAGRR